MRITNKMTSELITRDLYRNKQLLLEAQVRVATGKRINKISDDPIGMGQVLDYRTILSQIEQYNENIGVGKTHIELTETVLDQIETKLNEAKKWAEQYGSGVYDDPDSVPNAATILGSVQDIYDDIMNLANTKIGGAYLFAGHITNSPPFSRDGSYNATYAGDDGDFKIMVGDNVQVKINATGQDVFDGGTDVFGALQDLINALSTQTPADAQTAADEIRSSVTQIQGVATQMSVYYNRLESSESFLNTYKTKVEDSLEKTENVDMAQAVVEMQLQETAYVSNLESASKIIQPSLLDFLK